MYKPPRARAWVPRILFFLYLIELPTRSVGSIIYQNELHDLQNHLSSFEHDFALNSPSLPLSKDAALQELENQIARRGRAEEAGGMASSTKREFRSGRMIAQSSGSFWRYR